MRLKVKLPEVDDDKVARKTQRFALFLIAICIPLGGLSYLKNTEKMLAVEEAIAETSVWVEEHKKAVAEAAEIKRELESFKRNSVQGRLHDLEIQAIDELFRNSPTLKHKGNVFVRMAQLYWIDVFRMASISEFESANGTSEAATYQRNIAGINWSYEELEALRKRGYNPDIYNVKFYGSVDECVTALGFKLKTLYQDGWGLVTLSEIQTKWAPDWDPRNGLDGMDNHVWTENTIMVYEKLEAIYSRLEADYVY